MLSQMIQSMKTNITYSNNIINGFLKCSYTIHINILCILYKFQKKKKIIKLNFLTEWVSKAYVLLDTYNKNKHFNDHSLHNSINFQILRCNFFKLLRDLIRKPRP